jgi:hypothetical protein
MGALAPSATPVAGPIRAPLRRRGRGPGAGLVIRQASDSPRRA